QRAKLKDPYIVGAERRLAKVILKIIEQEKGVNECPLGVMDFEITINHSPTDNMQVKVQSLQMLLQAGIHPLIALKTVGLWSDAEKVFLTSKPYLDVLYKTLEQVEDAQAEEERARKLLEQQNLDSKATA
ncbi:MAG: phage portal protein, partial [Bacteroidales bacterium]|nr:phage portal protein [Bacteroidales bacterium]